MKRNIFIIILIIFNLWLCLALLKGKEKFINDNNDTINGSVPMNEYCKSEITKSFLTTLKYCNSFSIQISDSTKNRLKKLFVNHNNSILFFKIEFPYCGECVYPVIEKLDDFNILSNFKIIVITSFPNEEYLSEFKEILINKRFEFINIPDLDVFFDSKESNGSFLFTLNSDLECNNLFFNNKCNNFMIEEYLNNLSEYIEINF